MKNYLLLNLQNLELTRELLSVIKDYSSIHLNFLNPNYPFENYCSIFSLIRNNNQNSELFVYAHNLDCINAASKFNIVPHYCFLNDAISIKNDFYLSMMNNSEAETFWILDDHILKFDFKITANWLKELNRSICPSFSGNLVSGLAIKNHEKLRLYVKNILNEFHNPLFTKEVSLPFSSWKDNHYINNSDLTIHEFVLGIFGDLIVSSKDKIEHINIKTLMKNKHCQNCQHLDKCSTRGIGYIMSKLKLDDCCSYNLFQQNLDYIKK